MFFGGIAAGSMIAGCVDLKARIDAAAINKDNNQKAQSSQPIIAGRDASNISPIVNINGSDSILLALVVSGGVVAWLWLRSRRTVDAMVKGVDALPAEDSKQVKLAIEKAAYKAGVSQDLWRKVQSNAKRSAKKKA